MSDKDQQQQTVSLFEGSERVARQGVSVDWHATARRIDAELQQERTRRMLAEEKLASQTEGAANE